MFGLRIIDARLQHVCVHVLFSTLFKEIYSTVSQSLIDVKSIYEDLHKRQWFRTTYVRSAAELPVTRAGPLRKSFGH